MAQRSSLPADEIVYDESSLIRHAVPSTPPELIQRVRPDAVPHHVSISDWENEEFLQSTRRTPSTVVVTEQSIKPHKSLERLSTSSAATTRPVMTTYEIDEPETVTREQLAESVTVVREEAPADLPMQTQKTAKVKTRLTGSPLEAARYRAPEAAVVESLDESTLVRDVEGDEEAVAAVSSKSGKTFPLSIWNS